MFSEDVNRHLMQTATDVMRESRSEHRSKPDPLVGALLVDKSGNEVGRASRASLRVGNHAEYTLIERVLHDRNLQDTVLYATLEPCVSRTPPKQGCARWIADARISRVVIGMTDPNPDVNGQGIALLLKKGVDVDFFDADFRGLIESENKDYIEFWENYKRTSKETPKDFEGPSDEERRPVVEATVGDLSHEAISDYLDKRKLVFQVPSPYLWEFLVKSGFLVKGHDTQNLIPTVACIVLFAKFPQVFLPQCKIKAGRLLGTPAEGAAPEMVGANGQQDITGPLPEMLNQALEFFKDKVEKVPRIKGGIRKEEPEYPERALREVLVNALVHRDYRGGRYINFRMFKDRIVVESPGYAPAPVTLSEILSYEAKSTRRNGLIAATASYLGLMEEEGTGISKMREILNKHGLLEPEFAYEGGFFTVRIFGREHAPVALRLTRDIRGQLTPRQLELLDLLKVAGRITSGMYTQRFQISRETAAQDFGRLIDLDLIEKKGSGRGIYYILTGI